VPALALLLGTWLPGVVAAQAAPPNDAFANRIPLTGAPVSTTGSNVEATKEPWEPDHAFDPGGKSVWWSWRAPATGGATLTTTGSDFDTLLAVYTGDSLASLVLVDANDEDPESFLTSRVTFNAAAGVTYQIAVDGYQSDLNDVACGNINLSIALGPLIAPPANDAFAAAIVIDGSTNAWTVSNLGASHEPAEPMHAGLAGGKSVWWSWTAPTSDLVTFSARGNSFYTLLAIYTGTSVGALTCVASDVDSGPGGGSRASFQSVAGTTYHIAADGYAGAYGPITLTIQVGAPQAPAWSLLDVDGNPVRSQDLAGHVVLLNFWATWCGPCVAEIPDLIALQEQYRQDGLAVVGISVDSGGAALVRNFMDAHGINYPVVMATAKVQLDYGGINSIPATFIIDRQNRIVKQWVGSQSEAFFETAVLPSLRDVRPTIRRDAGSMVLSWPAAQVGYVLESTDRLPAVQWQEVTEAFRLVDGFLTYSPLADRVSRFYRLRK
jgi:peroxiredoxin